MWPDLFEQRLADWYSLRSNPNNLTQEQYLHAVNDWWWRVPMVNQYLSWDNYTTWPGPWDLLEKNHYCDLARCQGIAYTILMSSCPGIESLSVAQTDRGNLVLVNHGKYILNWAPGELLNIDSTRISITRQISAEQLQQHLGYNI